MIRPSRRELCAGVVGFALAGCAGTRPGSGARRVPLIYDEHGGLFVEGRIEERERVLLILDTGASRAALDASLIARLGLPTRPGTVVEGSAGTIQSEEVTARLEIGDTRLDIDATVYELASYEPRCAGIVGYELLGREPFRIEYKDQRLVLGAPAPERTVPLELDGRIPRLRARVNGVELALRLDTGASLAPSARAYVNLTRRQAERLDLTGEPEAIFTATGTGGATLELPVHRLEQLEVAGRALDEPYAIVQPEVGYFARLDAVGFLGNSVLDKLDPYMDYARGRFAVTTPSVRAG